MYTVEATPHGFSNRFLLRRKGGGFITDLRVSLWRDAGAFTIEGERYELIRERFFAGPFMLRRRGRTLAQAIKPSFLRARMDLELEGNHYVLARATPLSREFGLFAGDREIGRVTRAGSLTRGTVLALPPDWPEPTQVFIFWLALLLWRREPVSG